MEYVLGFIGLLGLIAGALASASAFVAGGSDIQLILGAVYFLCGISALGSAALLARNK